MPVRCCTMVPEAMSPFYLLCDLSWWSLCMFCPCWGCSNGREGHRWALRVPVLSVAVWREVDLWRPPSLCWAVNNLEGRANGELRLGRVQVDSTGTEVSPPWVDPCSVHEGSDISVSLIHPPKAVLQDVLLGCGWIWHWISCGPRHRFIGKGSQETLFP